MKASPRVQVCPDSLPSSRCVHPNLISFQETSSAAPQIRHEEPSQVTCETLIAAEEDLSAPDREGEVSEEPADDADRNGLTVLDTAHDEQEGPAGQTNVAIPAMNENATTEWMEETNKQCSAVTLFGTRCMRACNSQSYCWQHERKSTSVVSITDSPRYAHLAPSVQCSGTTLKGNRCLIRLKPDSQGTGYCHHHRRETVIAPNPPMSSVDVAIDATRDITTMEDRSGK
ncbi:hypothetical protein SISSUDRAFT_1066796 [Sistotremastrum suecicum HHB10207 ss-3]|uniref:Uncharacterized protein n=1 Tax=Sistotremastrum suecicum HHB10207 ss-3 TaxID=1314776 RepID=A0A165XW76_9AGAM|nr:hypothetical protein SISSUDRAFT_1066796 [Sistotremastrum suecicum HHB10207 ss-3]